MRLPALEDRSPLARSRQTLTPLMMSCEQGRCLVLKIVQGLPTELNGPHSEA